MRQTVIPDLYSIAVATYTYVRIEIARTAALIAELPVATYTTEINLFISYRINKLVVTYAYEQNR